ncbi:MAG: hypothetical protein MJZ91_03660 [Bacteroidales bacterium]|nr:hypothetical protein [Bacteroidales bacterium]
MDYSNRYKKWQWITLDVTKNTKDFRKESYRPTNIEDDIEIGEFVDTRKNWAKRKRYALKHVYYNMTELIEEAKNPEIGTSLAVFKPKEVLDFVWEQCDRDWDKKKLDAVIANQAQHSLFDEDATRAFFKVAKKVPYEFSYIFTSEDGKERKLMIEDWELGMLYWNCLEQANGNEDAACQKVREKYFDEMIQKSDFYFFLGTTKRFHNVAPNPFIIIGTFWPQKENGTQLELQF